MIYYLSAKEYLDGFIQKEDYYDILHTQYVIVSTRIRSSKKYENVIVGNVIFPNPYVCSAIDDYELMSRYMTQLETNKSFLAALVKGSIEENFNILFMCSNKEKKIMYLDYLSEFIYQEFNYPVYNYSLYKSGAIKLIKYDKDKVIKKCNKILKETRNKNLNSKTVHNLDKSDLKKILKEKGCYVKGMSKSEMVDIIVNHFI